MAMESSLSNVSFGQLVLSSFAACLTYCVFRVLHNIYFHPLAKFPGPELRAAFFFPSHYEVLTGDVPTNWHKLHEKYGDIVRINPNTLSIIKPEAWRDIYGHGNTMPLPKDLRYYAANNADHARIRRPLNHAFSEQALRSQEEIINSYITLMIQKLHKREESKTPADIMRWLNFTTFDITGDLTFDESFGSLEAEDYNSWIANLFGKLRVASRIRLLKDYPIIGTPIMALLQFVPALAKARHAHDSYTADRVARRLGKESDRKDFISYIQKHNGEKGVTVDEIKQTSGTLIIAGSETSATLLSGAIYYLLKNPEWMSKLHHELRNSFKDESQISFASLSQLKILNAIIQETFRMYPPVPTFLPRFVPKPGATICGTFIPPGTHLGITQYPAYRSSRNFKDPNTYAPQRFLGDGDYADDKRSVIQPFSVGPRNCIGQNLAWAEIRTILARLVWHFEFELESESQDWEHQKVFVLWQKPSLMVRLKARTALA
ncbi:benzoate 4-monooxygenase cytochrome P450 [Cucurbitaria berberidis CBS 394.84]|uniref:Benzoate 4-monooxygenase cytochrome P450 n=1 Tax=Cucurbitaria berberidis CBS 394.84 TaxID=1168544 RepID=A0A9P4LA20_9PLEO|nr:benzoate 4-monooxygenase cytochrome P450 [Cucurbitaria berberidis CBS 394.84]KAF1847911.1 benzoate 4-monooxygenase cytochrome P450 [Cucurbitaria berberidis CBS 394.84]